ncbi:MAG: Uma2 family endonuclease [Myxococcales bacterium]|nr:Uma2 family endonuclease [Myxococcales bacterium]
MAGEHHGLTLTEAEYLALPETNQRVELVEGTVRFGGSSSARHQHLLSELLLQVFGWANQSNAAFAVGLSPLDVCFGSQNILQPDLFMLEGRLPVDEVGPIRQVPKLCLEVLEADGAFERGHKRMLYAAAGVAEYWCVEPTGVVECWSGDGLQTATEHTDTLASRALPGLNLDVAALRR